MIGRNSKLHVLGCAEAILQIAAIRRCVLRSAYRDHFLASAAAKYGDLGGLAERGRGGSGEGERAEQSD